MFGFLLLFLSFRFFLFHFNFFLSKQLSIHFLSSELLECFSSLTSSSSFHHLLFQLFCSTNDCDSALAFFGWLILVLDVVCGSDLLSWKQAACFHRRMGWDLLNQRICITNPERWLIFHPKINSQLVSPPQKERSRLLSHMMKSEL